MTTLTTQAQALADELARLEAEATPGPWYRLGPPWLPSGVRTSMLAGSPDPHAARVVCDFEDFADANGEDQTDDWADAALIEFLRNNVPTIRAALLAYGEGEKMREALGTWPSFCRWLRASRTKTRLEAIRRLSTMRPKPWQLSPSQRSPTMDDLVKRLRGYTRTLADYDLYAEAADRIKSDAARLKRMEEALETLVEAVPSQSNDADWWPDDLTRAMDTARALLAEKRS